MDFGFGAFLEKFEANFGRGCTKCLLALIGLAVTCTCVGLIWAFLQPLISIIRSNLSNIFSFRILDIAAPFLTILLGAGVASHIVDSYRIRLLRAEWERDLSRSAELIKKSEALEARLLTIQNSASENYAAAAMLINDMIEGAAKHDLISPEALQEVRRLLEYNDS